MNANKNNLLSMLNSALELEHAARIQYLSHAELIKGPGAEKIIERLREIASDEGKHEEKFRTLIGDYLGGVPVMSLAPTHRGGTERQILEVNLKGEKEAIDFYQKIYKAVLEQRNDLQYKFEALEHEIRHIIIEEEEHVTELSLLLGI
jgi:bacterioferritin